MLTAQQRYKKGWLHDRSKGIARTVDAAPARAHARALIATGLSVRAVARGAGTSASVISRLTRNDDQGVLYRRVSEAILATTPAMCVEASVGDDFVPALGARRRIQALMALGHNAQTIAQAAGDGCTTATVHNILNHPGDWLARRNHDHAVAAYDALSMTTGTSARVRGSSAAKGWPPPLAWDDDTIDDPNAVPCLGEEPHHLAGAHRDDVALALDIHDTLEQAAAWLGISAASLRVRLRRDGVPVPARMEVVSAEQTHKRRPNQKAAA